LRDQEELRILKEQSFMARIVLDVPGEKMPSLFRALRRLGIYAPLKAGRRDKKKRTHQSPMATTLRKITSSYLLFDWEFFSNELEYE
jgi:hypothetical protein